MKWAPLAVAVAACAAATCSAQSWTFGLDGFQQVPVNASPGIGVGTATYHPDTGVLSWSIEWSGLLGVPTAMHFHLGAPGVNGPHGVHIESFTIATTGSAVGVETTLTQPFIDALLAGNVYVNIHTTAFAGGEIRGQVVPAPSAAACGLLGLGVLASRRRR